VLQQAVKLLYWDVPSPLEIRPATPDDVPAIFGLIMELAIYQKEPDAVRLTEAELLRDGWGPQPRFSCLVAVDSEAKQESKTEIVCGFALYHPTYSTWQGLTLYLEDLYVQPHLRGQGVGTALLARVAAEAKLLGCSRLDWSVLTWNEPAMKLYRQLGAIGLDDWLRMRMTGGPLDLLAERATQGVKA
jgi:GNAT superfamily N-acetyltransferase